MIFTYKNSSTSLNILGIMVSKTASIYNKLIFTKNYEDRVCFYTLLQVFPIINILYGTFDNN